MNPTRISIVTPSFNQGQFIGETLESVLSQEYPDAEFIVVDGGSTDQTVDVLKHYSSRLAHWRSEPDDGQADAISKGFALATGEICGYLNSDDLLLPNALCILAEAFADPSVQWVTGACTEGATPDSATLKRGSTTTFEDFVTTSAMQIWQQSTFWRASCHPKPYFDPTYNFRMDHDFFIRLYKKWGPPKIINAPLGFFRIQPNSKTATIESQYWAELERLIEREKSSASQDSRAALVKGEKIMRRRKAVRTVLRGHYPAVEASMLLMKAVCQYPTLLTDRLFWGAWRRLPKGR